jgi:hypothetical protein
MTSRAVQTAFRPFTGLCKKLLFFEVLSSTECNLLPQKTFRPQIYTDIEKTWIRKVRAFECYESEIREFPHPRSIEAMRALAELRGSEVGYRMAEGFVVGFIANNR